MRSALPASRRRPAVGLAIAGALFLAGCADSPSSLQPDEGWLSSGTAAAPVAAQGLSVTVSPPSVTLDVGDTRQLTVELLNPAGHTPNRRVEWSSSDPAVATVDPSGWVTGVAPGTTAVIARSGPLSATAGVTVVSPLPPPVAHFPLDGSALDATGNGYDGTIFGSVIATTGARGVSGTAMLFDGTTGYIEFGANLDLPGAFTLAAWIKPQVKPDGTHWGGIVGKFTSPGNWDLNVNDVTSRIVVHTSSTSGVFSPTPVQPDAWVHIVATYDGSSTIRIYTDGALAASGAGYGPAPTTSVLPRIGRSSWGGNWYKGVIDDVRVYDVELTAGEVARLHGEAGG